MVDKRGSTPLHWACYSRSEFALLFILSLQPDLEIKDNAGFTALHLAIKSVNQMQSCRSVRTLLLRGSSRKATNSQEVKPIEMINPNMADSLQTELKSMLEQPFYLECFMVRTPLVPLRKNHKTQTLFIFLFIILYLTQMFLIVPSK